MNVHSLDCFVRRGVEKSFEYPISIYRNLQQENVMALSLFNISIPNSIRLRLTFHLFKILYKDVLWK